MQMTQAAEDPIQQALGYMHHQGSKSFDDLIALMDRTEADWLRALEGVTDEQASFQPDGEWCAKEVLGHLLSANRGINQQIAEMAETESPHPSQKVRTMGETSPEYERMSVVELRGQLKEAFDETKLLLARIQDSDKLDQQFPHPLFGPLNLKEWFAFHRVHAMDHIQQFDKIKSDPSYPEAA
jgi:hypothetical protein